MDDAEAVGHAGREGCGVLPGLEGDHRAAKRHLSPGHQRSICVHIGTDEIQRSTFRMEGAALSRWKDWAGEGVFRLSVGLEDPADLIADLSRALD